MSAPTLVEMELPATDYAQTVEVDTRRLFAILTAHWKSDLRAKASSDPSAILKNPAFQMTVELGKNVLPLIFKEYAKADDDWGIALQLILNETPVPHEHAGMSSKIREDWLAWGKAHGYL